MEYDKIQEIRNNIKQYTDDQLRVFARGDIDTNGCTAFYNEINDKYLKYIECGQDFEEIVIIFYVEIAQRWSEI